MPAGFHIPHDSLSVDVTPFASRINKYQGYDEADAIRDDHRAPVGGIFTHMLQQRYPGTLNEVTYR